ncbi:MAG TPA: VOC family protein [Bacteroidota bacterium]|nr:VOC family protein [Bacteroidota bacterium]
MTTNTPDAGPFEAFNMSISLTVKDLQKSVEWYHEIIGFSIERRNERDGKLRSVYVNAGTVRLALNQDDGAKGWDRTKGVGFSFNIKTNQDIDEIAKRIKANGGTLDMEPTDMPWGSRVIRLTDPDHFKFSISRVIDAR